MAEEIQCSDQIARVRAKLEAVRRADPDFKVFGAAKHKYRLGPPLSETELTALEAKYGVRLPAGFRAFVAGVGNGHPAPKDPYLGGAGPYYGIHDAESVVKSANAMRAPIITPDLSDDAWQEILRRVDAGEIDHDDLTSGCAFIVDLGCSYSNLLAMTGPNAGRVIYYDEEGAKPQYAFECNFLDWYERWLDEILGGYLTKGDAAWFGMTMGGDDRTLLAVYDAATDGATRTNALRGLFKLVSLTPESVAQLSTIASGETGELRQLAVESLVEFAPDAARPHLEAVIEDDRANIGSLCASIRRKAMHLTSEAELPLLRRLERCRDHDEFFGIVCLLKESGVEIGAALVPFCRHEDPDYQSTAIWALGAVPNRVDFVPVFAEALRDGSENVVIQALQAIEGLNDPRLTAEFPGLRERFSSAINFDGRNYVLINLEARELEAQN